jgi:uncharacterized protein (TIRG00374 family)
MTDPRPAAEHLDEVDEQPPALQVTRRKLVLGTLFIVVLLAFLYYGLPQIAGLEDTWHRIEDGDPVWFAVAVGFTIASFGGYVLLFQHVYVGRSAPRVGYRESYEITMASLAATRLFAAGGAAGIALTAWALRRAGMGAREVADRSIAFLAQTYVVYMAALIVFGLGLRWGVFEGPAPWAVTVIPAIFAMVVLALAGLMALTPTDLAGRLEGWARRGGRLARLWQRAANLPAAMSAGIRLAVTEAKDRPWSIVGAMAYWAAQIGILWAAFMAFGESPPLAVLVMGYFVGMFANLLPLPGGVGGVDGGMIGALTAFGVGFNAALVAVLTYRAVAYWLPTLPGAIAYFQLRRTVARWSHERRAEREGTTLGKAHATA